MIIHELLHIHPDESEQAFDALNDGGLDMAMQYMKYMENDEYEVWNTQGQNGNVPWGTSDVLYRSGNLMLAVHYGLRYMSLYEIVEESAQEWADIRRYGYVR